jgi:benzoyl-CoA 2,3-dioxygenase component B
MDAAATYSDRIPNNVNLAEDRTLQRALEHWQPNYLRWWRDMGPEGSQAFDVYLRTAVSVDPSGVGALRLREDAGLPLGHLPRGARSCAPRELRRAQGQSSRGRRCRASIAPNLRRIIVTQGDTEPGVGRAAATPRPHRAVPVRPAQPVPG